VLIGALLLFDILSSLMFTKAAEAWQSRVPPVAEDFTQTFLCGQIDNGLGSQSEELVVAISAALGKWQRCMRLETA
jgi:hypothetical protein